MSEVSSAYSSTSRITGLYSDLDTDAIIEDLLQIQQNKVDAKSQEKTTQEWYSDALDSVNDLVENFRSTYLSALTNGSMLSSSTYKSFTAEITGGSTTAVSISTATGALTGSYTIDSITQLAENAAVSSTSKISSDGTNISESNTTKLAKLDFATDLEFDSERKISFSINGKKFSFDEDDSLQSMINTINADEDAGVTMKYSRLTDTFTITADEGGADSSVTVRNISGNAFGSNSAFGIGAGCTDDDGYGTKGQDAIVSIEGVSVIKDSNEFTIDGITYNLKNTSEEEINFDISRDISSTVESIKSFIDAYNELVDGLNSLLDEKDYSHDYEPLTSDQEDEMSDAEIESWNTKAKSGLLRGNDDLESFMRGLKSAFTSVLGGTGSTASSIGIASASYFSSDSGKILVDEDKLTSALEKNPERIISMFTESDDDAQGLIYKIFDSVNTYLDKLDDDIDSTGDKINKLESKIDDMNDDLSDMAERYYNKFSVMEEALSRLNSQASMLSSLFST
ncbi:MAG: flagellar filament capping protein FliD [Oscillospiraceae bacterium]